MKKKLLLLTVLVIALTCIFAISVSAAEPDTTKETFTLTDGTVLPIWDTDGNGLIWYASTNNTEDGFANYDYVANNQYDTTAYPYVEKNTWSGGVSGSTGTGYQLSWFKVWDMVGGTKTEVAYSRGEKVVLANLQGMLYNDTTLFNCFNSTFQNAKKMEGVYFDEGTKYFIKAVLNNCYLLRYTNVSKTSLIYCGGEANFAECKVLDEIVLPDTVQVIGDWQFQTTAITEFTIPSSVTSWGATNFKQCYYLENVYGYEALIKKMIATNETYTISNNTFLDCNKLNMPFTNGVIPEGITRIGDYAFDDCYGNGWENIILPNTLTNIGQNAFQGCKKIEKVVLGASFATWDSHDGFKNCSSLKEVYMPATMTAIAGNVFNTSASNCVFYFTGTKAQLDTVKANTNSNNTAFLNAYNNAVDAKDYNPETMTGKIVVYNYSQCDAFYDGQHTNAITYGFDGEDKLSSNFCEFNGCTRCSNKTITTYGTLITNKGYSKEQGGTYFVYTIVFNKDVIARYLANTEGATFSYGVVAAKYTEDVSTGILFDEAGAPIKDCVAIDATGAAYSVYSLKITDLDKVENSKSQALYCCAYVVDNGAIKYVADEITDEAVTICYNDIDVIIDTATTPPATGEENA